jgi:hypothetical protein
MVQTELIDLETTIKKMPGVLGCVILATPDGAPSEIQAFTQTGADQNEVQKKILSEVATRGLDSDLRQVFVFELEAETHFGDRETLERAAELAEQEARIRGPVSLREVQDMPERPPVPRGPGTGTGGRRPPLLKVAITSSEWRSEAEVALGGERQEAVGLAEGEKTPHGLKVLAQATLDAALKLVDGELTLRGASLVKIFEEEAVLVLVDVDDEYVTVGAALTRGGPVAEATVRATLDAINRRLAEF